MISLPSLITFIVYLVLLITIGGIFYRRTASIEDYILGGRGLGKWVTALSAQASDMSGWLLMGLPGAMYVSGLPASWIAIGLFIGTVCNWQFVATRLRVYTEKTNSITLPCFFEDRFRDPTGLLRTVSALIILIFFTIYTSSGLVAAGKLFESMFHMDYRMAVSIGTLVIVVYTFLGGFLAVSWTDMIQGTLMVIAITIVPVLAWQHVGGYEAIHAEMAARNIDTGLLTLTGASLVGIISTMAWGLGYFGQPHILVRFMGIREVKELRRSMAIAITWVFISLIGAAMVGLIAIPLYPGLESGDQEKVFIYMVEQMFNPWVGGIFLAAILSAIMSTIDSQLLVSSSALTEDFYQKVIRKDAPQKRVVQVGRICVIGISVIALLMALNPDNTVLGLVAYAWGGFGAAFGPLVLFALFSRKTSWQSALAGMVTGTVVLVVWKQMGLGETMYEIVPGFVANVITMLAVNRFIPATNVEADKEFEEVRQTVKLLHS